MSITEFLSTHGSWKPNTPVAIAVSGGADSLALLYKTAKSLPKQSITAITFDHQLRPEAHDEALYVQKLCKDLGVAHVILSPNAQEKGKQSQNWARTVRYNHLLAYCASKNIPYLLFAHHQQDQQETLYIRLLQDSNLYGLCGMQKLRKWGDVHIARPLLGEDKQTLMAYLQQKNVVWIKDPSNDNSKYLRVRLRKLLGHELQDFTSETAIDSHKIQSWRNCMGRIIINWLENYAQQQAGQIIMDKAAMLAAAPEFRLHIMQYCLDIMGKASYMPSLSLIQQRLAMDDFARKCSLHHCVVSSGSSHIYIQQEYAPKRLGAYISLYPNYGIFDERFAIRHHAHEHIDVEFLGNCTHMKQDDVQELLTLAQKPKNRHFLTLPVVFLPKGHYILPIIDAPSWEAKDISINRIKSL